MESASPTVELDEFYVLKRGEILGPFTATAVREKVDSGDFQLEDFVQSGGVAVWQPLSRWLTKDPEAGGAIAPDWKSLGKWAALRLQHDVLAGHAMVGLVCAAIGGLVVILSHWPAALWLPWFAVAIAIGVLALRSGRTLSGLLPLVAVAVVPVIYALITRDQDSASKVAAVQPDTTEVQTEALPPPIPSVSEAPVRSRESAKATPVPVVSVEKVAPPPPAAPSGVPALTPVIAAATPSSPPAQQNFPPLPPPTPTLPPIPEPASVPEDTDLVQRYHSALVLVKEGAGAGSGFVCKAWGQPRLFTNIHVVAGMKQPQFTALSGAKIAAGAGEAAAGHDVMRFELATPPAVVLEMLANLEATVKIGDPIVVLGNSGGGGVVTKLGGKLVGIGPDRVEVSAEFIPGNSGSPIIHVPTGKVIGIATYLMRRYDEFSTAAQSPRTSRSPALVIRRFGYRLDSVTRWEPVNWGVFQAEADRIQRVSEVTEDVFDFLNALRKKETPQFATEALRRPASQWMTAVSGGRLSEADRLQATQTFLSSLRWLVRGDVASAETQLRYSYFREELRKEREVRDKLYKAFDDEGKKLSSPSTRGGL
ncbi:MAG TPA: serine protease [Chthoniobacteraceae bacterium]|nr:serine protease [Chthoniobacteraceae bacterium]